MLNMTYISDSDELKTENQFTALHHCLITKIYKAEKISQKKRINPY